MKKIQPYLTILLIGVMLLVSNCSEDFLKEEPLDFLGEENFYKNPGDFEAAVNALYIQNYRNVYVLSGRETFQVTSIMGTDLAKNEYLNTRGDFIMKESYNEGWNPLTWEFGYAWSTLYDMIKNANFIIANIDKVTTWESEAQRNLYEGETKYFRAWWYFLLTQAFGDVPLVTEPSRTYKTDFVRTPKPEICNQIVLDLTDAIEMLPELADVPGKLNLNAARHLLANVYLFMEDWQKAEQTASLVINSGHYQLMDERFGIHASEPGTPWTDLFFDGNINRVEGNLETIWTVQANNYNVDGGQPHIFKCLWLSQYENVPGLKMSMENWQRGKAFMALSDYYVSLFEPNDDRGSEYAIKTVWTYNDAEYIQSMKDAGTPLTQLKNGVKVEVEVGDTINRLDPDIPVEFIPPILTKFMDVIEDRPPSETNSDKDIIIARLAETYLFRAEARFRMGDLPGAAEDINMVRRRVNASEISAGDVNLDFILDERARELIFETSRRFTLTRTDKLIERNQLYNPPAAGNISEKHNLWPIPQSEIDLMLDNPNFGQNPGYN